uniref:Uncharacterized protein n=1 Tax=Oryza brachyantha TaxID=4533 RepID=J3NB08_ORYBR
MEQIAFYSAFSFCQVGKKADQTILRLKGMYPSTVLLTNVISLRLLIWQLTIVFTQNLYFRIMRPTAHMTINNIFLPHLFFPSCILHLFSPKIQQSNGQERKGTNKSVHEYNAMTNERCCWVVPQYVEQFLPQPSGELTRFSEAMNHLRQLLTKTTFRKNYSRKKLYRYNPTSLSKRTKVTGSFSTAIRKDVDKGVWLSMCACPACVHVGGAPALCFPAHVGCGPRERRTTQQVPLS